MFMHHIVANPGAPHTVVCTDTALTHFSQFDFIYRDSRGLGEGVEAWPMARTM
jgi:hypothetical protein